VASSSHEADTRARQLIIQAFEEGRRSGRTDWRTMTVAVLKNRLLNLTDRSFKERDYGARSIADFVRSYPDLLALDESHTPPYVTILTPEESTPAQVVTDHGRIRPDLWSAIVDYESGFVYTWDGVAAQVTDPPIPDDAKILPTLSIEDLDAWRQEFISESAAAIADDVASSEQVQNWATNRLPTRHLPILLRRPWNRELKRRVLDRLTNWFATQNLALPHDLVEVRRVGSTPLVGADTLRQLVMRCVQVMTEDELRQLSLPPSAVLRAYGTAAPGRGPKGVVG
jgi:OST-HTH/LOTUS domain